MREQVFQNLLLVELSKIEGVRVWRQNSGRVVARRGGAVKGAPVGAADITGIVGPEGWRLELECKGAETRITARQLHWLDAMQTLGAIALSLRVRRDVDVADNVASAVAIVRAAIAARRAGG